MADARASSQRDEERVLELVMKSMNGTDIAVLECAPTDTVYELKQRVARLGEAECCAEQKLVFGGTVLHDSDRVGKVVAGAIQPVVTCVRLRRSGLASILSERGMRAPAEPSEAILGSVFDVADSVLRREHELSESHRPAAADISKALSRLDRARLVSWIVETFSVLEFGAGVLYGAVLNLDRYCARRAGHLDTENLGLALLAAICTEMKLASTDTSPYGDWRRLVMHMCQNCYELRAILRMEHEVLTTLNYTVGVPTAANFFGALSLRLGSAKEPEAVVWTSVGFSLLHLSLLDVELNFHYSHAVLAAAALSAALGVCRAPEHWREALCEDLTAYVSGSNAALTKCEAELLSLWQDCESGQSDLAAFFGPFRQMLGACGRRLGATLSPAARLSDLEDHVFL